MAIITVISYEPYSHVCKLLFSHLAVYAVIIYTMYAMLSFYFIVGHRSSDDLLEYIATQLQPHDLASYKKIVCNNFILDVICMAYTYAYTYIAIAKLQYNVRTYVDSYLPPLLVTSMAVIK